jgi:hypothetical protein
MLGVVADEPKGDPQAHLFACSASRSLENVQCAGSFDSQGLGLEVA